MSTFAQQTTRSRHTSSSSSSIQSTTPVEEQISINRSYGTQSRTGQSRERSASTTLNKINTSNDYSTTIDSSIKLQIFSFYLFYIKEKFNKKIIFFYFEKKVYHLQDNVSFLFYIFLNKININFFN